MDKTDFSFNMLLVLVLVLGMLFSTWMDRMNSRIQTLEQQIATTQPTTQQDR